MYILPYDLRQAQPGAVTITTAPGETQPNSMIVFTLANASSPVSVYLKTITSASGKVSDKLALLSEPVSIGGTPTYLSGQQVLASNLVSLYFTYPSSIDTSRVIANLAQQKTPFKNKVPVQVQSQEIINVRN